MIEKLFSIFSSNQVSRIALVTTIAANIIKTFEQEFAEDHDAKNAAIDTMIDLLKMHKDSTVQAPKPQENAPPAS